MSAVIGSASVSIVPSMQGFAEKIRAQLLPEADRIGQEFGARLGRNARERLEASLKGLPDVNVDADTAEAQKKIKGLRDDLDKLSGKNATPTVGLDDRARARIDSVKTSLDALSKRVATAKADVDDKDAKAKLLAIEASLLRIGKRVATPRIDLQGVAAAEAQLAALDLQLDKLSASSDRAASSTSIFSGHLSGLSVATAALLPTLPTLAGGILAVGGAFAAAGTAALSGGVVLAAGVSKAVEANKQLEAAQKAVDDATTASGRNKALAEQAALIDKLGPSMIAFGQALRSVGDVWSAFAQSFIPQEVELVAGFERLEKDILPALKPLVSNTFGVFGAEIGKLDAAVNSKSGQSFFSWLAVEGPRDLEKISDGLGNFAAGFGHLTQAATPLIHQLVDGFDDIGASFNRWSQGLGGNSGFQHFLTVVETDGPILVHTLGDVAAAIGRIGIATSPILPVLLRFVDDIATLINDHPGIAASLGAMFLGFQALKVVNTLTTPLQLVAGSMGLIGLNAKGAAGEVVGLRGALLDLTRLGPIVIPITIAVAEVYETAKITQGNLKTAGSSITHLGMGASSGGGGDQAATGYVYQPGSFNPTPLFGTPEGEVKVVGGTVTLIGDDGKDYNLAPGTYFPAAGGGYTTKPPKAAPSGPGLFSGFADLAKKVGSVAGKVAGNPDVSTLASFYNPLTGGASSAALPLTGGGSSSSNPTAAQTMAAVAALQGVNLGNAFLRGVQTGVSPIDTLMTSIQADIGSKAQPIADQFKNIFDAALQYGQAASASLIPNLTSGLPQLGSMTNVTVGPDGKLVTTQASPILGGLQLTLGNDKRFAADVDKARKLGLSQTLLSQFVAAGPSSLDQLDQLVNGSPGDIKAVNATFGQITALGNAYGAQQATAQGQAQTNQLLQQLIAAVAAQAPQLANALNGVAKQAAARQAAALPQGVFSR